MRKTLWQGIIAFTLISFLAGGCIAQKKSGCVAEKGRSTNIKFKGFL